FTDAGNTVTGLALRAADAAEKSGIFVDCGAVVGAGHRREYGDIQPARRALAEAAANQTTWTVGDRSDRVVQPTWTGHHFFLLPALPRVARSERGLLRHVRARRGAYEYEWRRSD